MLDEILGLLAPREGHFRYESGHHGDLWLEVARLYVCPARLRPFAASLARRLAGHGVEAVCGPMVEGALLAQMVAEELGVAFGFAEQYARNQGEGLFPLGYRIPGAFHPVLRGRRTAIVDDVINAGSAVRGALAGLVALGARPVALGALLVLGEPASELAAGQGIALEGLAYRPGALWIPSACPLCARGLPLERC
jgi:orotate phosphoribosyltransferase